MANREDYVNASDVHDITAARAIYNADHPYAPAPVKKSTGVKKMKGGVWIDTDEPTKQSMGDQAVKADAGKPRLSLAPMRIVEAIARVREYGCKKYSDPDNWKKVDRTRYVDAMLRHALAYVRDPDGVDEESGLPHLWHLACNVAFLVEMRWRGDGHDL